VRAQNRFALARGGSRFLLLAAVGLLPLSGIAGAQTQLPKLTVIGDSVADRMQRNPAALAALNDGYRLNLQTHACRTLIDPGCTVAGQTGPPPSVLDVVNRFGDYLGKTVVIESGYNDVPTHYQHDLNTVMRGLQDAHVKTVVWLTLRDPRGTYQGMNDIIRGAVRRWHQLVIADWNTYSADHPDWFNADDGLGGIHPTALGAANLGQFIHTTLRAHGSGSVT
jgi:hypothetical protein